MSDKELKLIVAGQCMAGILANSYEWNINANDEELARWGWNVATELMALSKKEEIKPEPIVFEAIVRQDMPFAYLSNVPDGIPLGTKFKCVQILEEKK
ncbi:MAG: hypothetical protein ACK5X3_07655 [Pseudomonadota bacterium]